MLSLATNINIDFLNGSGEKDPVSSQFLICALDSFFVNSRMRSYDKQSPRLKKWSIKALDLHVP